jgi:hypothetical protein
VSHLRRDHARAGATRRATRASLQRSCRDLDEGVTRVKVRYVREVPVLRQRVSGAIYSRIECAVRCQHVTQRVAQMSAVANGVALNELLDQGLGGTWLPRNELTCLQCGVESEHVLYLFPVVQLELLALGSLFVLDHARNLGLGGCACMRSSVSAVSTASVSVSTASVGVAGVGVARGH